MNEIVALNVNHSSPAKLKPFAIVILLLAICPRISAQESRPVFSSDHVLFDTQGGLGCGLKPEKYRSRAEHYEFIAFTDGLLDREYRANKNVTLETIANDAARTVKQQNPKATVLFNWAADLAKPHNKISNKSIPSDERIILRRTGKKTVEVFDTTNPSTRNWWTDVAAKAVHDNGCDGIFIDGTSTLTPGSLYQRQLGEKNAALENGMFSMLSEAKRKMGGGSVVLLNPLPGPKAGERIENALGWRCLPFVDGAMVDDFDRTTNVLEKRQSKECIVSTIRAMAQAAKRGQIVVFKAWPGFNWRSDPELMKKPHEQQHAVSVKNLEFPLACFLIGAEEQCYFCYTLGGVPEHGALGWYPEFEKPLGRPQESIIGDEWTFRREFAHASVFVDVDVNVEKRVGKVDWK